MNYDTLCVSNITQEDAYTSPDVKSIYLTYMIDFVQKKLFKLSNQLDRLN